MKFTVLGSGSTGNAVYVQTESVKVLVDAGLSCRQLQARLRAAAGVDLADLDALLITHEHVDHVRGLTQLLKRTRPDTPVYLTEGTRRAAGLDNGDMACRCRVVRAREPVDIGGLVATPIAVSHDAEEPVAYRLDGFGGSLAILTDLGYVSDVIKSAVSGCHTLVWETNHDVDMLRAGRYPWNVKRRILSDKGHLSNADAGVALAEVVAESAGALQVYLAHLSQENNLPDLARVTVEAALLDI
ncbi:MAG: MBL fold metallo-hydrolase, partial [Alicyclobacillus sp.]|nr:MBL fold metallo-hydrolase [Alicyclobacillus sp.]